MKNKGITLIALIITIILLLLIAGVAFSAIGGENGLIGKTISAAEQAEIAMGKERIETDLLKIGLNSGPDGKPYNLETVNGALEGVDSQLSITGARGEPINRIYVAFKDYEYKITDELEVIYIGKASIKDIPDLEIIKDKTETGVDEVNLTIIAFVEQGEIDEIVKPDGSKIYATQTEYLVKENGEYTFSAVTNKGVKEERTIKIENIKENGIDISTEYGGNTQTHEHIYQGKYNDTQHWKQCILCNEKTNIENHNMGIIGTESCAQALGKQTKYCTSGCGYNVVLPKKEHSSEYIILTDPRNWRHYKSCKICGDTIIIERCYDENGNELGCHTGKTGTCALCGYIYTNIHHESIRYGKCGMCEEKFYNITSSSEIVGESAIKYMWHIQDIDPAIVLTERSGRGYGFSTKMPETELLESSFTKNADGSIDVVKTINVKPTDSTAISSVSLNLIYTHNGYTGITIEYNSAKIKPDYYAPIVQSVVVEGTTGDANFSRKATITAKFTETWDSVVQMALYDEDGKVVSNWGAASKSGTTFTRVFDVVAETTTDKTLIVKAKDRCGNIGEGRVVIGKIDTKPPTLISNTLYNQNWSINKKVKIEATDEGAGQVNIAYGDISDYKLGNLNGNIYSREYNFVGDLYEDVARIIYLKDGVGNMISHRITLGKIDRTSPKITNITKTDTNDGVIVNIEANDLNTELNKEGSGIYGYAISKGKEVPNKSNFSNNNEIIVKTKGTHYVWVRDNAGNISAITQVEI